MLEGGGFNYEPRMQALYAGKSIGDPYQVPLEAARLHYFGGQRLPSGELAVSEQAQRKHRILNGTASLRPGTFPEEMRSFFLEIFGRRPRTKDAQ